ncbi:MAG TPA: ABC transporter permease [Nitrososphaeraceae archaeon]|nr:ABC transporter permease [Nitrososphaeraceae archaeon]
MSNKQADNNNNNSGSNADNIEFPTSKKNLILNNNTSDKSIHNINNNLTFISEFIRRKSGIAGVIILLILVSMTIYAFFGIPSASFKEWNNPNYWIDNPRLASPIWSDFFGYLGRDTPEHLILSSSVENNDANRGANKVTISTTNENGINVVTHSYHINYNSDIPPNDFMITYSLHKEKIPPAIEIELIRPNNNKFDIYFDSITPSISGSNQSITLGRIFSTDSLIHQKLLDYLKFYNYKQETSKPEVMLFSNHENRSILKGNYTFNVKFYLFNNEDEILNSKLILGGEKFGLMGTDELRRDLTVGLVWGAPVALFIGLSVSTISIVIGMIYGIIAGYKGKRTDESLMRINDIFYSLPTLPLLIIMSLFLGRSIFLIVLFLIFFGWMGTAKISRSLALQIKNFQYVEAAKLIGQSDIKIIFKHIIPQLLPLTFASIAISVPGAILAEASLSFIGLGDPSIPTWGQILHEAHTAAAASRGLWWWLIPPGMLIALTGLAFVLIGNTIDSLLNPKMKRM